jgi:hypothetical protein
MGRSNRRNRIPVGRIECRPHFAGRGYRRNATREIRNRRDAAMEALVKRMEKIKRRWLFKPPLLDSDFIAMLLSPPDETHSAIGIPATAPVFRIII